MRLQSSEYAVDAKLDRGHIYRKTINRRYRYHYCVSGRLTHSGRARGPGDGPPCIQPQVRRGVVEHFYDITTAICHKLYEEESLFTTRLYMYIVRMYILHFLDCCVVLLSSCICICNDAKPR